MQELSRVINFLALESSRVKQNVGQKEAGLHDPAIRESNKRLLTERPLKKHEGSSDDGDGEKNGGETY